jgi:co-chaperonin GroES (HSP10)
MIQPVNGHLLIEPVKQDTFIAAQKDVYEEIGVVLAADPELLGSEMTYNSGTSEGVMKQVVGGKIAVGDRVYFDAWLAAKFPGETEGEFYWLVKWEDVRAIENGQKSVSE